MNKETIEHLDLGELLELEAKDLSTELQQFVVDRAWSFLFGELRAVLMRPTNAEHFEELATIAWNLNSDRYKSEWIPYLETHLDNLPSMDEESYDVAFLYPRSCSEKSGK